MLKLLDNVGRGDGNEVQAADRRCKLGGVAWHSMRCHSVSFVNKIEFASFWGIHACISSGTRV